MRKTLSALVAAAAVAGAIAGRADAAEPDSHVAVISVDGLGVHEIFGKPTCLAADSTIRALANKGAYARAVTGVLPTITYPTHATISTGVTPARHGVVDNGLRGVWFRNRSDISGETLWDAARKAGRTVAIVTWPSTYGADANWLIPEDLDNGAVPTANIRKGSTPRLFDAMAKATGAPQLLPFAHPEAGTPLDAMTGSFAAEVVRRYKPGLLLTHFLDYDHRMHAGPYSQEACKALARIDGWIGKLVEAYRLAGILDRTTFFIVSDHGFLPVKKLVNLYALLDEAGFREIFPGEDVAAAFDLKIAGGSVGFYPGALKAPDAAATIEKKLRPRIEKKLHGVAKWLTPARARAYGGFPGAFFTLCARPDYSFTALLPAAQLLVDSNVGAMHGYCPDQPEMDAMFIASGYGVRPAGVLGRMSMTDMAPTIAAFVPASLPQASGKDVSAQFRVKTTAGPAPGR